MTCCFLSLVSRMHSIADSHIHYTVSMWSCRFRNFLFNCEADKVRHQLTRLPDVWAYIHCQRRSLSNLFYRPAGRFVPPVSLVVRNVTLWQDYFCRYSAAPTVPSLPDTLRAQLFDERGLCRPLLPPSNSSTSNISNSVSGGKSSSSLINSSSSSSNDTRSHPDHELYGKYINILIYTSNVMILSL